jgi:hypothetical protein
MIMPGISSNWRLESRTQQDGLWKRSEDFDQCWVYGSERVTTEDGQVVQVHSISKEQSQREIRPCEQECSEVDLRESSVISDLLQRMENAG